MAKVMLYSVFIAFGLAPAIIWLLFYLKKDSHPESKKMVLKMFFYGMLSVIIAALIELGLLLLIRWYLFPGVSIEKLISEFDSERFSLTFFLIKQFIIIALVEELCKFLVIKFKVLNHSEFDEPVDAMLYMIIVALGFAALENILYLQSLEKPYILDIALLSSFRFLGANLVHALSSGIIGYSLALAIIEHKKRFITVSKGIIIAILLHGLFNISILKLGRGIIQKDFALSCFSLAFLIMLLSASAFFVSFYFRKVKKMKSICRIK